MEEILKYIIFSSIAAQSITILWFVVMLQLSLKKIQESYKDVTEEEKNTLINKGLSTIDVFKSFLFYNSLKNYLWYDYALKEKKKNIAS